MVFVASAAAETRISPSPKGVDGPPTGLVEPDAG